MAIVIGGNTTIFSFVHAILTKPAAGVQAQGLVTISWVDERGAPEPVTSYANYLDLAARSETGRPMLGFDFSRFTLTDQSGSYAVQGARVSTIRKQKARKQKTEIGKNTGLNSKFCFLFSVFCFLF